MRPPVMTITFTIPLIMKLLDYVRTTPALSPSDCDDLINLFIENKDKHIQRLNPVQSFTELNYNNVAPPQQLNCLARKIKTLVNIYTDQNPTGGRFFPQKYGIEEFRIKCYNNDGNCFNQHVDIGDLNSSKRFLAFLFYLNDDFEGGTTVFKLPDKEVIKPESGTVLMFPPTWQYPHEGKPVITGTKYIMSTYLNYV